MRKIKVGLVEIGDSFGGQHYFPYSLGILQAYAQRKLPNRDDYEFAPILYKRNGVNAAMEKLFGLDVVFFSAYLWNFMISLDIAKTIKKMSSTVITVFGGPQVPETSDRMSVFLHKYPFIDIACFGEGEIPFTNLLKFFLDVKRDSIPSTGHLDGRGVLVFNAAKEPVGDINEIPSPYLEGVFDGIMRSHPGEKWQGLLETNRGCPFTCAFCYWGKKNERKVKSFDLDRVHREIDWFSRNHVEFVFCCDANFGIFNRDLDIARKVADNKVNSGYPKAFSVQNTKNSKARIFELQKTLNDAGLQKGVNLALQSLNETTLKYSGRSNIDNKTYHELQKLFSRNNIHTFTDLIIGLPGESYDSFTNGVSDLLSLGQHNRIQFINLTILENTLMAEPEFRRAHELKTVESAFIPHHSSLNSLNEIMETQFLVVGSRTMPESDWIKIRIFSWMTSLLHFNKLLQIPFIILNEAYGVSYKDLIDIFVKKDPAHAVLAEIISSFEEKALQILGGDSEYSKSKEWLNITWYPDELTLITLSTGGKLTKFFDEAKQMLIGFAAAADPTRADVISQAIALNQSLIKQPFVNDAAVVRCDYNVWEVYQSALKGDRVELTKGDYVYRVDRTTQRWTSWDDWCREVIWYGNKRGDYAYTVRK